MPSIECTLAAAFTPNAAELMQSLTRYALPTPELKAKKGRSINLPFSAGIYLKT
jgi:hypothetical protein